MLKYIYPIAAIMSLLTFVVGWNHYVQNGFQTFNVGFMAMTPITTFILTSVWLKRRSDDESENV